MQKSHQLISHGTRNRQQGACLPHSYEWGMRRRVSSVKAHEACHGQADRGHHGPVAHKGNAAVHPLHGLHGQEHVLVPAAGNYDIVAVMGNGGGRCPAQGQARPCVAVQNAQARQAKGPFAIIMKTVKGKGVSYMEHNASWHGKAPNDDEYQVAMDELRAHLAEVEGM